MTEKEALLWVLGILGILCAAAITGERVEQGQLQHTQALARDLRRFDEIDEVSRLTLDGVRNLLDAQLSGNNREGMQKSRADIDNYLLKGVTNHGSTGN